MNEIDKYLYQFSKLKRASLHGAMALGIPLAIGTPNLSQLGKNCWK